jgi:hypothetical protein
MAIKNRLAKIEVALAQSTQQTILKIDDMAGLEPIGWRHKKDFYGLNDDLSHLCGIVVLFAEYADWV